VGVYELVRELGSKVMDKTRGKIMIPDDFIDRFSKGHATLEPLVLARTFSRARTGLINIAIADDNY
jgi:hypothetical protein